jgi:hypothetical protein
MIWAEDFEYENIPVLMVALLAMVRLGLRGGGSTGGALSL